MSEGTDRFKALWAAKCEAHEACREARGRAYLDAHLGRENGAMAEHDAHHALMRQKHDEAIACATEYVQAHRDDFHFFEGRGHARLVQLVDHFRETGDEEAALQAMMWEIAKFERQEIGGGIEAKVRVGWKD